MRPRDGEREYICSNIGFSTKTVIPYTCHNPIFCYLLLCTEVFPVKSIFNRNHEGKSVGGHPEFVEPVLRLFRFVPIVLEALMLCYVWLG